MLEILARRFDIIWISVREIIILMKTYFMLPTLQYILKIYIKQNESIRLSIYIKFWEYAFLTMEGKTTNDEINFVVIQLFLVHYQLHFHNKSYKVRNKL